MKQKMPLRIQNNKCQYCGKELKFEQKYHTCPTKKPDKFHRVIFGYKWYNENYYEIVSWGMECRDPKCMMEKENWGLKKD